MNWDFDLSFVPFEYSGDPLMGLVWLAILFVLYFLPTIIAMRRRHHQRAAIFLLNLLLGWTFFGWVIALIWSATAVHRPAQGEFE